MCSKLPKIWWIRNNVGGLFSAFLTVFLILYAMVVVVKLVILPWMGFNIHVILFVLCCLLSFISHCLAQFSNPGSIPETFVAPDLPVTDPVFDPENPLPVTLRICKVCLTLKPQNTYHCSICGKCILRMDHHCPWVNNCVGIYNQKYFILFLFYTALCCIYTGVLLVLRFFSCTSKPKTCNMSGLETALCIVAFIEALIFGLFVIIMMFDQISAIMDEDEEARSTYEEEYEKSKLAEYNNTGEIPPRPAGKTTYEALCEVFGEKPSLGWFIPRNPRGINEVFQKDLQKCQDKADKTLQQIVLHLKKSELKYKALQTMEERLRNDSEEIGTKKQDENLEETNRNEVEENSDNSNNTNLTHRRAQKIKN